MRIVQVDALFYSLSHEIRICDYIFNIYIYSFENSRSQDLLFSSKVSRWIFFIFIIMIYRIELFNVVVGEQVALIVKYFSLRRPKVYYFFTHK